MVVELFVVVKFADLHKLLQLKSCLLIQVVTPRSLQETKENASMRAPIDRQKIVSGDVNHDK